LRWGPYADLMVGSILFGALAVVHGVLFWTDFRGYARTLTRGMRFLKRGQRWQYSLGEGRFRRTGPRWEIHATPGVRRLGGGWGVFVGTIAIVLGLVTHR
jgi:hypothetical protein